MAGVADNMVIAGDSVGLQLCPCGSDVVVETCSLGSNDTYRDMRIIVQTKINTAYRSED